MLRKRSISLLLTIILLLSLSIAAFAASEELPAASAKQGILSSESFDTAVYLSLDELAEIKSELDECEIPYTIQGNRAVAMVNVTTNIHYANELYFFHYSTVRIASAAKNNGFHCLEV